MKDIEDELKEKYDEVEVPEYMFDTSRVFKRVKEEKKEDKKKIISTAASIVAIILIAVALIFTMPSILRDDEVNIEKKAENNLSIKGEIEIVNENLRVRNAEENGIYTIKVNEIISNQIINNIPYTKVKAQVLNSYLGNLTGEIEMYVPGGIFTVKDIKENIKYGQIDDISKYADEDILKVAYYNEIYIPVAEEGKTYITTVNDVNGEYFVDINRPYGFKEYNPETNIVKDDMGDEELDIQKYLESINL